MTRLSHVPAEQAVCEKHYALPPYYEGVPLEPASSLSKSLKLFFDVTATLDQAKFTGVQRVVSTILSRPTQLNLVKFSPEQWDYREAGPLPKESSQYRDRHYQPAAIALHFTWSALQTFLLWSKQDWVLNRIRGFGKAIYKARTRFSSPLPSGTTHSKVPLEEITNLVLLDVPSSPAHVAFLKELVASGSTSLHVYLYDLIPIDSPMFGGEERQAADIRLYLSYLELAASSATVICLSEFTRERFVSFCERSGVEAKGRIVVLYPPQLPVTAKTNRTSVPPPKFQRFLSNHRLGPLIMSIAPLTKRKNLSVVFTSFSDLIRAGQNARLLVVVPPSTQADFKTCKLALRLKLFCTKRVMFVTALDEDLLTLCYEEAHVVAVPSLLEGFGLPVVEALEHGCHVLSHNEGPFVEISRRVPIDLADARNKASWTDSVAKLLKAPEKQRFLASALLPSPQAFLKALQTLVAFGAD